MTHHNASSLARRWALVFVALLVTTVGAAHAQERSQVDRAALVARLDSLAKAPVQEGRAAGISVAVVHGRDTLLLKGYGKANIELDLPMPANAVHEIGSVTKQFTAAAILQLRDDGLLSLDDDLTKYLPDFPAHGRAIPLRRLLDHTSGIMGITEIAAFGSLQNRGWPRDSAIALIARAPFQFPVGEAMIYNNSAYFLLGLVIEQVSGMSYEGYVQERIFAPLGMSASSYCDNGATIPDRATGYQLQGTTLRRAMLNDHTWPFSSGSLCSTAGDLVTWLHAFHGGRVLSARSYEEMTSPARLKDGTPLRYGMGVSVGPDPSGAMAIEHGGAIPGFLAHASWYPDAELSVIVLINTIGPVSPTVLARELARGIVSPAHAPYAPRFYTADATDLVGRYAGPGRGGEAVVVISRNDEGILVRSINGAPAQPLPWIDGWRFGQPGTLLFTFERTGAAGPATLLRFDVGTGYHLLRRTSQ